MSNIFCQFNRWEDKKYLIDAFGTKAWSKFPQNCDEHDYQIEQKFGYQILEGISYMSTNQWYTFNYFDDWRSFGQLACTTSESHLLFIHPAVCESLSKSLKNTFVSRKYEEKEMNYNKSYILQWVTTPNVIHYKKEVCKNADCNIIEMK